MKTFKHNRVVFGANKDFSDPKEKAKATIGRELVNAVVEHTGFNACDLTVDLLNIEQSPEWGLRVQHYQADVYIYYLMEKVTREVKITVEYPSFKDGHVVEYKCKNIPEAARVFEFAVNLLADIRGAIDTII